MNEIACDLIVFDMAGTTVHDGDAVNVSLRGALLDEAGCSVTRDAVNRVMGIQKPVAIHSLLLETERKEPSSALVDQVHDNFVKRMLEYYASSPDVYEVAGVSQLFDSLHSRGVKIGVDTGFSRDIAQVILDRLAWQKNKLIDTSITADEVAAGRPAPYMIFRCMEHTAAQNVSRVMKVGDTPSDLHEGKNAGCKWIVGVTQGSHTEAELSLHPHTHLIPTVKDLMRCFL